MRYLIGFLLIIMCPVLIAQNGFIRGLIKDTQTEKWQFYSMNMDTEVATILQFLPDTIEPLSVLFHQASGLHTPTHIHHH